MIQELKTLIESILDGNNQPLYSIEYEETKMMNLKADEKSLDARFAYIEEFIQGSYTRAKLQYGGWGQTQKITQVQIYFCRFGELQSSAMDRDAIRSQIESEIVLPFMNKYNDAGIFDRVDNWKFYTPLPRFDANEVSVMLQFNCNQNMC